MAWMMSLSRVIDGLTERVGRIAAWLVLAAVAISAGNAISRKAFSLSSNALLEAQWYLFGAVFMLGAAWTLKRNEHIRIDIISSRLPKAFRDWLEIIGHAFFLIPFALIHLYFSVPFFMSAFRSGEVSTNVGGLPIWPAKLLILVGFGLLLIQGFSELIKRIAITTGHLAEEIEAGDPRLKLPIPPDLASRADNHSEPPR
jgi:TRAP-type mannitol/chloroaromatic compound transport system permease small subunit